MLTDGDHIPECSEKSRLMDRYSAAISEFSRSAAIVNAPMGTMYKGDYDRLARTMNEARVTSEECHRALIAHIAEQRC